MRTATERRRWLDGWACWACFLIAGAAVWAGCKGDEPDRQAQPAPQDPAAAAAAAAAAVAPADAPAAPGNRRRLPAIREDATGRVLFEGKSDFNDVILVRETFSGVRMLQFGELGATQTSYDPENPDRPVLAYARTAMVSLGLVPNPKRILVVGLGGGAMPRFLRMVCPEAQIDAVEIDPVVVDVAKRFFDFKEDEKLKAHVADGRKFIEESKEKYDLIYLDAYGEDSVPYSLATKEFLTAVRARLAEKGWVVSNVWGSAANPLYRSMVKTHLAVFDELHILQAPFSENRLVMAAAHKPGLDAKKIEELAATASPARARQILDLRALARDGYERIPPQEGARVLLDADAPKE